MRMMTMKKRMKRMRTNSDLTEALANIPDVNLSLRKLFSANPQRFEQFSLKVGHLLLDYSKQSIDSKTIEALCKFAKHKNLVEHIHHLFSGAEVNATEKRAALHTLLRDPAHDPFMLNNKNIKADINGVISKIEKLVIKIQSENQIKTIISLGIGGSDLGPAMVTEALKTYQKSHIECHFISNVDVKTLVHTLKKCDPEKTLCIINSKTFTTPETLLNAKTIRAWMSKHLKDDKKVASKLLAVTSNTDRAKQFGIVEENIFEFWDFVGGRYSVWSSVGIPIALTLGIEQFKAFLSGAHSMDNHFKSAPLDKNMPVIMALLSIWNSNKFGYRTQAIIPYDDGLRKFPDYLQQLMMESNGKGVSVTGEMLSHKTSPIIWGGVGCNGQHAYMQLLHQGTDIIPVDFLIAVKPQTNLPSDLEVNEQHKFLIASCLSQSKALMEGTDENKTQESHKICQGNRPSNTLIYPSLTPEVLGSLIALYEHIVFVQSILWGINAFDQFGVELGKEVVKQILPCLEKENAKTLHSLSLDSSSLGLIKYFHEYNE